jgi:hypothetical protein
MSDAQKPLPTTSSVATFRGLIAILAAGSLGLVGGCAKPLTEAEMPHPKAGLWARVSVSNGQTDKGQVCMAGKPFHVLGPACPGTTFRKVSDGVFETENRCEQTHAVSDIKDRYSGDFQSAFVENSTGMLDQEGKAPFSTTSRNTFTYVGPCPPGLDPIDLD